MTAYLATAAFSYLLGSIPFGYILVRLLRGKDIRRSGSGNIGATNVARSSPALGLLTLLFDSGKGFAAVALTRFLYPGQTTLGFLAALFAVIGHIFPVWLRFRGGKGVATGLGSFLLLAPKAIAMVIAIFVVMLLAFRRVSLGSIVAVASLPVFTWVFYRTRYTPAALALMACACLLVIIKHHENIRRLLSGTEPRFQLRQH